MNLGPNFLETDIMRFAIYCAFTISLFVAGLSPAWADGLLKAGNGLQWFKGNTHTHTLWSDGDGAPELSVAWYKEHGYDFLSLTDHNIVMEGDKWFPVKEDSRLTPERLQQLKDKFGEDWIVEKNNLGIHVMKLKTYDELRERFEEPGKFILIYGEEITSKVHINGLNLRELVEPSRAESNVDIIREHVHEVDEQSRKHNAPMLTHVNHPNFSSGVSAEDMIAVPEGRFFEIYNGHGSVKNWGDPKIGRSSTDREWDVILTYRLRENPDNILYGLGTDDTHDYFHHGAGASIPGRGVVVVLADTLDAGTITQAIMDGQFYASSGVVFEEISWNKASFRVVPKTEEGVTYTTQFFGTRKGFDDSSETAKDGEGNPAPAETRIYSDEVGAVLYETTDVPAVYEFQGDEIYVRAKITSSKLKPEPFKEGDLEMGWTQPVVPGFNN